MRQSKRLRRLLVGSILVICVATWARPAGAVEEAQRFLNGLREQGLFDTALDYLEQMRTSPLCPPEVKDAIDYEAGVTLVTASRTERVSGVKEKSLDQAQVAFKKFLKEHPEHKLAAIATTQLANVLVERGRMKAEQAQRATKTAEEKKQLNGEARVLYEEAKKVFEQSEKNFYEKLKAYPKFIDPKKKLEIEERDQARKDLLQSRLYLATVIYELALTYEPGTKEWKENLEKSAKSYNELYDKYGSRLAGLYARLWEGRCYKVLGDDKKAFEVFEELLMQPDEPPAFRTLKNKALILALETYMLPKVKNYAEAIKRAKKWQETARGPEENSEDGLVIKFVSADAALSWARALKPDDDRRKDALTYARKQFGFVSRFPGDYEQKAKAKLRDPLLVGENAERPEPENFIEARDRGKAALDLTQELTIQIKLAEDQGKKAEIPKLVEQIKEAQAEALKYYRMALGMTTPNTPVDDINVVRYYLAYLYWINEDLWESAIMGEFLARKYPNSAGARQGAKISMAAYVKLFNEVRKAEDNQFETDCMVGIADFITKRWPDSPEADEAWMMLIRTAVVDGKPNEAAAYLEKVSPDSPRRGEAELMTGQSLWGAYLQAARLEEGERPSQEKLDAMVKQAQDTLTKGIERMRKQVEEGGEVSYTLAAALLSLSQIYIGAAKPDEAIKWLDDPKIGPVTLVAANNPLTNKGSFRVETYKAALRAYVAAQQLEKAEQTMNALEKEVAKGGDKSAASTLTRIYISLGRELQELLERLRNEKKTEDLEKVAKGFELFLTRISERKAGNTFNSLNWVAETFFGMGAGFDPGGTTLPPEAKKYYQKAADTYKQILATCKADPKFAPAGATTGLEIRLAKCQRRMGNYKESLALLVGILKKRTMMIDAQVEAAYTYQAWGQEKSTYYLIAIKGSAKYKEVWGWGRTSKLVARSPKHISIFHEARYNLALCRMKYALTQSGKTKSEVLKQAEGDITIVERLYPDMGGDEWRDKYDKLLRQVQKLRGEKATGLAKAPAASKSKTSNTRKSSKR